VEVRAENNPNGREIIVSVKDSGPGIQDDVRHRLFEKFSTGNTKGRGSGLGLAFCRLVVEAHGGRIWAQEQNGSGTTISMSIPLY
jgi:signal transduction histidine kinase